MTAVSLVVIDGAHVGLGFPSSAVDRIVPAASWPDAVPDLFETVGIAPSADRKGEVRVLVLRAPVGGVAVERPLATSGHVRVRTVAAAEIHVLPREVPAPLLGGVVFPSKNEPALLLLSVEALLS
jgi:hypothetical protein